MKVRTLTLILTLSAASACGQSTGSGASVKTPAAPISTTTISQPLPTSSVPTLRDVIVGCGNDGSVFYLDPATGAILKTIPGPGVSYSTVDFAGTDLEPPGLDFPTCGNGTYNKSMTKIAGTRTDKSGTRPAVFDLAAGQPADILPPIDTSGFEAASRRYTTRVEFSPYSDDLWYITTLFEADDASKSTTLVGPSYSKQYDFNGAAYGDDCDLVFPKADAVPIVTCSDYSYTVITNEQVKEVRGTVEDPQYLDPDSLPQNNRGIANIRLSDSGESAAFIEHESAGSSYDWVLWVIPSIGATPRRIGIVDKNIASIVRIGKFAI